MKKDFIPIKQKTKEVFILPDSSIAYSMKRASVEYKKITPVEYTASDLILLLMFSQEQAIRSKTVLFKELFVFERDIFKNQNIENCKFVPYYYGPYSFYMANKLDALVKFGLVEVSIRRNVTEFKLSKKGKKSIKRKYLELPIQVRRRMEDLRKGLDQHGVQNILKAIYKKPEYQEYIVKSRVAHRYKLITWGKSKWPSKT